MSLAAASRCTYSRAQPRQPHRWRWPPALSRKHKSPRCCASRLCEHGANGTRRGLGAGVLRTRDGRRAPDEVHVVRRFPGETLDYVARQRERAKLVNAQSAARAADLLAGRKPPKTKPRTRIFCARSTRCAAPGRVSKRLCRSRCRGARSQHFARRAPRQRRCSASLRARRARLSTATARSPPTRADPNPARSKRTCTSRATLFRSAF